MWRFLRLSIDEQLLLGRAVLCLVFVRFWLPFASLERLRRWAQPARGTGPSAGRIVWAVSASARRLPGTTCLPAALVLHRLLRAAGHESELHIGVAHEGGGLAAHAWIARDGEVLIGEEAQQAYASLLLWR